MRLLIWATILAMLILAVQAYRPRYLINLDRGIQPTSTDQIVDAVKARGAKIVTEYNYSVFKGLLIEGGTLEEWKSLLGDSKYVRSIEVDATVYTQADYIEPGPITIE